MNKTLDDHVEFSYNNFTALELAQDLQTVLTYLNRNYDLRVTPRSHADVVFIKHRPLDE